MKEKLAKLKDSSASDHDQEVIYAELESDDEIALLVEEIYFTIRYSDSLMAKFRLNFMEMNEILMMNILSL